MSKGDLDALRQEVREAEQETAEAQRRLVQLRQAVNSLPSEAAIHQTVLPAARRLQFRNLVLVLIALIGLIALYAYNIEPSSDFDASAAAQLERQIERLHSQIEESSASEEMQAVIDEDVRVALDAHYPAASGEARGRQAYPGLSFGRTGASEQSLRWANIGLAACTVRHPALAQWAARILSERHAPHSPDGAALSMTEAIMGGDSVVEGEDAANELRVFLHVRCPREMDVLGHLFGHVSRDGE